MRMVEILSGEEKSSPTADAKAPTEISSPFWRNAACAGRLRDLYLRSTEPKTAMLRCRRRPPSSRCRRRASEGELLALVEQPGEASRLINTPKPAEPPAAVEPEQPSCRASGRNHPGKHRWPKRLKPAPMRRKPKSRTKRLKLVADAPEATVDRGRDQTARHVRIEAVEIDGDTVFVAGSASAGRAGARLCK